MILLVLDQRRRFHGGQGVVWPVEELGGRAKKELDPVVSKAKTRCRSVAIFGRRR